MAKRVTCHLFDAEARYVGVHRHVADAPLPPRIIFPRSQPVLRVEKDPVGGAAARIETNDVVFERTLVLKGGLFTVSAAYYTQTAGPKLPEFTPKLPQDVRIC